MAEDGAMTTAEKLKALWKAVKGDGCTNAPDIHGAFQECCNRHDADYTHGCTEEGMPCTRAEADARLLKCMQEKSYTPVGKYVIAPFYYAAVRLFGKSHWTRDNVTSLNK